MCEIENDLGIMLGQTLALGANSLTAHTGAHSNSRWRLYALFCCVISFIASMQAQSAKQFDLITHVQSDSAALFLYLPDGVLRIEPCAENIARITFSPQSSIPNLSNPIIADSACSLTHFTVSESAASIVMQLSGMSISISRQSGAVRFLDASGRLLLREIDKPSPRSVSAISGDNETTNRASVWFKLAQDEWLYGLGQHNDGVLNQRYLEIQLSQENTYISIPFFVSSQGYGVLWNATSETLWNNRFEPELEISSSYQDAVDYFFVYGPSFDSIIHGYRKLTGAAPLFPLSAYGYWQSKSAYATQKELLGIAAKYRELHIPIDNIVIDAPFETQYGSGVFDARFPDPKRAVSTLAHEHINVMVNLKPWIVKGSARFDKMEKEGDFIGVTEPIASYYPNLRIYDAFNPQARKTYWEGIKNSIYAMGISSFWLDSDEPVFPNAGEQGSPLASAHTALGPGSRYEDIYPFMTASSIYDGYRTTGDNKRIFILSRSAYTGIQRKATAVWSGDTTPTFETLRRQIVDGLDYSMTGLPYWTTDIGGFLGGNPNDPAYQELYVRWFQFGVFCPLFRAHGARPTNEIWSYGPRAQSILTLYDRLRYRMLPYIYDLAAQTTFDDYTPMRSLAFDFRNDPKVLDIGDEYMFGQSLLVAPVIEAGAQARSVYLPEGTGWYDFWTGQHLDGGKTVNRQAPLTVLPLYVRAGTILPLGPEEEYTEEHPDAPIVLRIYRGADTSMSLYQDDGLTYQYEDGEYAKIPITWNDKKNILTMGERKGQFPGMRKEFVFRVVLVTNKRGTGEAVSNWDRDVKYDGLRKEVDF